MQSVNRRFYVLLLLSLLLHLVVLLYLIFNVPETSKVNETRTVNIKVITKKTEELEQEKKAEEESKPEPEPEKEDKAPEPPTPSPPEPEVSHAPISNSDKFASNNQSDKSEKKLVFGEDQRSNAETKKLKKDIKTDKTKPEQPSAVKNGDNKNIEPKPSKLNENNNETVKPLITSENQSGSVTNQYSGTQEQKDIENEEAIDLPTYMDDFSGSLDVDEGEEVNITDHSDETRETLGNIKMLDDPELNDVFGEQPFSEERSDEIQMVNKFLDRMNRQVLAVWRNPYKGNLMFRGVAKLELNVDGRVEDVYVYISSGIKALDDSVIDAIKSVGVFKVPENKVIAERYSHLKFHFSSINEKNDKLPFELDND